MTQEEKELLLKDLCARLPYRTKILITGEGGEEIDADLTTSAIVYFESWTVQPYLRPMSSMTEKERYEIQRVLGKDKDIEIFDDFIHIIDSSRKSFSFLELQAVFDWLNKNHFDYRGLIEKGLALEAPEGMYEKGGNK